MALTEEDKTWIREQFKETSALVTDIKESLEREIGHVVQITTRLEVRLDKIAAGSHYVTRLVEWSEKQDAFQVDILHGVQALEKRLEERNGKA